MQNSRIKQVIIGAGIILAVFAVYGISLLTQRAGRTEVAIQVSPSSAKVTIDGKTSHSGSVYVSKGKHTFKASADGYSDDSSTITVGDNKASVYLLPTPQSQAVKDAVSRDQKLQTQREAIGGARAEAEGQAFQDKNPIVSQLPFPFDGTDELTPADFEINYATSTDSKNGIAIQVNAVRPDIRKGAVDQIKLWGYDPSDMYIQFLDFKNPLASEAH
ncbi:MAG TPA: PEGA domain-containing protein [Candidatus Saccharimonadales bacterium]|nr:PEGA domain-containing protein [Candidatus Saccharimonadales bacterium]